MPSVRLRGPPPLISSCTSAPVVPISYSDSPKPLDSMVAGGRDTRVGFLPQTWHRLAAWVQRRWPCRAGTAEGVHPWGTR
jgi:hypothetical protein